MAEALILDHVRTPRGGADGGSLRSVKPVALVETVLRALADRVHFDPAVVDDVLLGCVTPVGEQGANIARAAALTSGWGEHVSGSHINRGCASGLEAVNIAAAQIRADFTNVVVAGGVESPSRVPLGADASVWHDPETSRVTAFVPQGIGADLLATIDGMSRDDVDEYALESHKRANYAQVAGKFGKSLTPVRDINATVVLAHDETIQPSITFEDLSVLKPSFATVGTLGFDDVAVDKHPHVERIDHVHTYGNSAPAADGASVLLIAADRIVREQHLVPRARIAIASVIGVDSTMSETGPALAARAALRRARMRLSDIDLFEVHESYAATSLRFIRDLDLSPSVVNVNGGAIALGHPMGATGAMQLGSLLDELERRDLTTGLAAMSADGGMGVATIIERV